MRRPAALVVPFALAALAAGLLAASPGARAQDPEKPAAKVEVGAEAPGFTLKDQDGNEVSLASFRGKKNVVIAFYPKAGTPGCTREMKCFSVEWRRFEERGAQVLGVSGDPVPALKEFATSVGARFPLLSDADHAVSKAYGVFKPSPAGGLAARSIFLVDREGKIRWIELDFIPPAKLEGNPLLAQLDLLKPEAADPTEALAALPAPEKDAKIALVRYVQAFLAEDPQAIDGMLHPDFGSRPGTTAAMAKQRRDAFLGEKRRFFEAQDLLATPLATVLDVRDSRVLAKGDHEKPGALAGFGEDARKAAAELAEGDLLVVARTKGVKVADELILPRELIVTLRKERDAWKIAALSGK